MSTTTLKTSHRVLPPEPYGSLEAYQRAGGGAGLKAARAVAPDVVIAELEASGLRGRGGAGFPTGRKWRTIAAALAAGATMEPPRVVVNVAEGEPGTFKDRAILSANPYAVIEGALIAASVFTASTITIATKERFVVEAARLRSAIAEVRGAGWAHGVEIDLVEGPGEYLYGEETALLEVLSGRPPFPRIAPPWRRGLDEFEGLDATSPDIDEPPALVNNVETFANIASIIANGAAWFREVGTEQSPGTVVCTLTGAVPARVVEVPLGTPLVDVLADVIDPDNPVEPMGVLMGVSNAVIVADDFDVPISYEAMAGRGTGLGSASFIVFDAASHPVALAAGASRFLAVESCGQCTACKVDGLEISRHLADLVQGSAGEDALDVIDLRLTTVTDGARCNLAAQQQTVVGSLLTRFRTAFEARLGASEPLEPEPIAEIVRIEGARAVLDSTFATKQPDWTYDEVDSGKTPAERL